MTLGKMQRLERAPRAGEFPCNGFGKALRRAQEAAKVMQLDMCEVAGLGRLVHQMHQRPCGHEPCRQAALPATSKGGKDVLARYRAALQPAFGQPRGFRPPSSTRQGERIAAARAPCLVSSSDVCCKRRRSVGAWERAYAFTPLLSAVRLTPLGRGRLRRLHGSAPLGCGFRSAPQSQRVACGGASTNARLSAEGEAAAAMAQPRGCSVPLEARNRRSWWHTPCNERCWWYAAQEQPPMVSLPRVLAEGGPGVEA